MARTRRTIEGVNAETGEREVAEVIELEDYELHRLPDATDVRVARAGFGYTVPSAFTFRLRDARFTVAITLRTEGSQPQTRVTAVHLEAPEGGEVPAALLRSVGLEDLPLVAMEAASFAPAWLPGGSVSFGRPDPSDHPTVPRRRRPDTDEKLLEFIRGMEAGKGSVAERAKALGWSRPEAYRRIQEAKDRGLIAEDWSASRRKGDQ